jgi:hypothetical protein
MILRWVVLRNNLLFDFSSISGLALFGTMGDCGFIGGWHSIFFK